MVLKLQISSLMDIQNWQLKNDSARKDDQSRLFDWLAELERNQAQLMNVLSPSSPLVCHITCYSQLIGFADANQNNMIAMMTALQRQIEERSGGERERQFYSNVLSSLSTASKTTVQLERWMITSYEVEFGRKIGFGGLYGS